MESAPHVKFPNPFPCASPSPSPRRSHPLEPKATRSTCRGFRAVCGVSGRRAVSGLALLGAAASCANLLGVPMPVQAAMLEPDVIRYCVLPGYEPLPPSY
ncbi:unnamed protein product [Triticum turgidum subsp. durum]|uniref:Uncharacterized protein n=1 Tax=Triticum turgidum subsp. durum TaxID=4567 RepID=A0A9R1B9K6_TRITD|nr:unnamed protein product [Triticum turgidum subsp. durum]